MQYQQLTPEQVQIWLKDRVTQEYLKCLGVISSEIRTNLGNGTYRDPKSNDLTCNNVSSAIGMADAYDIARNPIKVFATYETPEGAEVSNA